MEEIRRSARSVEEAVEAALGELGLSEQEADVQVVQEPRSGVLGVGAQEAIVVVRSRIKPDGDLSEDDLDEQAEIATEFLEGMLERMGITATVEPAFEDGTMYVEDRPPNPTTGMGRLIGRHADVEAIQERAGGLGQRTDARPSRLDIGTTQRQIERLSAGCARSPTGARTGRPMTARADEPLPPQWSNCTAEVDGAGSSSEGRGRTRGVIHRKR